MRDEGEKVTLWEGGHRVPCFVRWSGGGLGAPHDLSQLTQMQDVLAEVRGAHVPAAWPGRELAPLAGVSLGPVLAGGTLPERLLYFLYNTDRGLREGDWKLASFQSNPWELYNLAEDRTELHDLASQKPEVRDRLARLWFRIAATVDECPASRRTPVLETAKPVSHPEWTGYDSPQEGKTKKVRKKKSAAVPLENKNN